MSGNSSRRGAVRKTNKKERTVGSGGVRRRALEGKGPTPKAEDRPYHPKAKKAAAAARAAGKAGSAGTGRAPAGRTGSAGRGTRPAGRASVRKDHDTPEVIGGRNAVVEALRTGVPASTVYVATRIDMDDRVKEALTLATTAGIPVLETGRAELDRLVGMSNHQGLAMQVPAYDYAHPEDLLSVQLPGIPLIVALDGITDPRNLGAIIRGAAAFGAHGVVVPQRRPGGLTASAWKTSAGAAARLPVAMATNLTRTLHDYREAGFFVIGLDGDGDISLPQLELATSPLVVVIGAEGKGLSRLVSEACDQIVSIPMTGMVESLNASVAAGVALYEIARQRTAQR